MSATLDDILASVDLYFVRNTNVLKHLIQSRDIRGLSSSTSVMIAGDNQTNLNAISLLIIITQTIYAMSKDVALKSFNLANSVLDISPQDEIYHFDVEANKRINREAPWLKEFVLLSFHSCRYSDNAMRPWNSPHYFKSCKISAVSLIKMVMLVEN